MRVAVEHASADQRPRRSAIERDPVGPAGGMPAPAFAGALVTPSALLQLQRTHGNRFVQRLLDRRAGARPNPTIQRAVKRAEDGTTGEAGWTRLDNAQWVWKADAEARWNAIAAVYGELEALYLQLGTLATQHDNHPRIRRAQHAMFPYTIGDNIIPFDRSEAVLTAMTEVRERARGMLNAPPAADSPGQLTPHARLTVPAHVTKRAKEKQGEFETRKKLVDTKKDVNTMVGYMDEADRVLGQAKTVWERYKASTSTDRAEDLADARLYVKDAWRAQQEARHAWRLAAAHPYNTVTGMPNDQDVTAALTRYTQWWKTFATELSDLDRALFTTGKARPDGLTVANLENDKPDVFRSLVLLKRLTLAGPGNAYKRGGNKTFDFKETKDWELHIHEESTIGYQRGRFTAHYKPVSEKYTVGFNLRNPVDMATLHTLGVYIS